MKTRPILFSAPMVRATLAGRKTQTRRAVKPQPPYWLASQLESGFREIRHVHGNVWGAWCGAVCRSENMIRCPYGAVGDELWVRESFAPRYFDDGRPAYRADWDARAADVCPEPRWKPGIHMPRWASRITLHITGVRVERLLSITTEDAIAEGFDNYPSFCDAFYQINAGRITYADNPWVWVIGFQRVEPAQGVA